LEVTAGVWALLEGGGLVLLDWRRERYVWVPLETVGTLQALRLEAQALVIYIARLCDPGGVIRCNPKDALGALTRLCGVHLRERKLFSLTLAGALQVNALALHQDGLFLPEFLEWQVTRDRRRRLYAREVGAYAHLPTFTRAFAAHLVRTCDDDGLLWCKGVQDWALEASRAQYSRGDQNRLLARRAACHIEALLKIGFLERTEDGFRVTPHAAAQRAAEPRAALAHAPDPPDAHKTLTSDPQDTSKIPTRRYDPTPRNHMNGAVPPSRVIPYLPSNSPPLSSPVAVGASGPASTEEEGSGQQSRIPDAPASAAVVTGSRRVRVAPPKHDQPIAEGDPGFGVYDFIIRHPLLSAIIVRPGEFVYHALGTFTLVDLAYEVTRAAEYLLYNNIDCSNGRRFLLRWLDRAHQNAKCKAKLNAAMTPCATPRFAEATAAGDVVEHSPWGLPAPRGTR
jgi:hypothetical protein